MGEGSSVDCAKNTNNRVSTPNGVFCRFDDSGKIKENAYAEPSRGNKHSHTHTNTRAHTQLCIPAVMIAVSGGIIIAVYFLQKVLELTHMQLGLL